jgi:predicted flap endonuclease-1-like 5' DNA nuclease
MAEASVDRENMVRSAIVWAIALLVGIVVAFLVGWLLGFGAPAGLIFGAAAFIVLPYLVPARGRGAETAVPAPAVHRHAEVAPAMPPAQEPPAAAAPAPVTLADIGGGDLAEAPAAAVSERVREAARAAGAAARALTADEAVSVGAKPPTLSAPRDGTPDNLRRLKGVGPKLEVVLHELGIFHFDQIAAWGPEEIAWIDANLDAFSGRIVRENWVGQAAVLAAGGETEHSRLVDRGEAT